MASRSTPERPGSMPQSSATGAQDLSEVAAILRSHASPAAQRVALAFETKLDSGGDLERLLRVKVRRGKSCDVPATRRRREQRNDAVRALASTVPGNQADKVRALQAMLSNRDQRVLVIHETIKPVPGSTAQLALIIKGA